MKKIDWKDKDKNPQACDRAHECPCPRGDICQTDSCYNLDRQRQPINKVILLRGSSV